MAIYVLKFISSSGIDYYMRLARVPERAWGWKWQAINFNKIVALYPLTDRIYGTKYTALKAGREKAREWSNQVATVTGIEKVATIKLMDKEDVDYLVFIYELVS